MWIKQGCIFNLDPSPNRSTHAQVPTPLVFDDRVRVYYACRNNGKSFPAFFDLDRKDLKTILRVHEKPIMRLGKPGMFDSDGIMPSCIIRTRDDELWMYYIGWNARASGARYQNEIGLAVSKDNGETFERIFEGPIVGRIMTEPGIAVMPFVMHDNDVMKMWYQTGTGWSLINEQYEPTYVIKYAESANGITWNRYSETCVKTKDPFEAFSRPCVIKKKDHYSMWYCERGSHDYRGGDGSYRIGYARSNDGINFERANEDCDFSLGNENEFDSNMQCYPYVIEIDGKLVMFYNGNDFGQTGIGLAIWEW